MPPDPCECQLAGYCERHKLTKNEHWHKLCQRKDVYRQAWDEGSGPGQRVVAPRFDSEPSQRFIEQARIAWKLAHSCDDPSQQWYQDWKKTIPKYGCDCRSKWASLEKKYPPPFGDLSAMRLWFIDRHNDVNVMLGKPVWTPPTCVVCGKPATTLCSYTLPMAMCGAELCDTCKHEHGTN